MRLALVQMDCTPKEEDNLQSALAFLTQAARKNADLVVLPELFNTGYYLGNVARQARNQAGPAVLEAEASRLGVSILAGMPQTNGGKLYNAAHWFAPGQAGRAVYRKNHLFAVGDVREADVFTSGASAKVVQAPFGPFGVQICFDLRYPDAARLLARQGAQLLLYPSAFGAARIHHWRPLLKARAIENQCFVAGCNRVGTDDMKFGGKSTVYGPQGELLGELDGKEEGLLVADLDFRQVQKARSGLKLW
ncbi:carbon-nitrogen hydrolase family protein [Candidatus Micrarchaeota archaeon]|nr:carbon-nitrogen hydrolase family protein [Candidatus Micrarchaeota archaeon]